MHGENAKTQKIDGQVCSDRFYCPFRGHQHMSFSADADYCRHLFSKHTGKELADKGLECENKLKKYQKTVLRKEYLEACFDKGLKIHSLSSDFKFYQYYLTKKRDNDTKTKLKFSEKKQALQRLFPETSKLLPKLKTELLHEASDVKDQTSCFQTRSIETFAKSQNKSIEMENESELNRKTTIDEFENNSVQLFII